MIALVALGLAVLALLGLLALGGVGILALALLSNLRASQLDDGLACEGLSCPPPQ